MPSKTFTGLRTLLAAALACTMIQTPLAQEDDAGRTHTIPLFMSASDPDDRQGFVRVINHTDKAGTVRIYGIDDSGNRSPTPAELAIGALETKHFNSDDFENGNAGKGLSNGVGSGDGDWRLELHADDLDIEPLAYIRTKSDGFLTSMHDVVAEAAMGHRVPIFNPASNVNQVSSLRLINPGDSDVNVTIVGTDDRGVSGEQEFTLVLPANGATRLTATDLENGASNTDGELGDGTGKWSLSVSADGPIQVMSLMSTPTGHLSNLSAGRSDYRGAVGLWRVSFDEEGLDDGYVVLMPDSRMYAWLPESADLVRIAHGTYRSGPATVSGSGELYESGKVERVGFSVEGGSDDFEFTADYRSGDWMRGEYTVEGGTARAFRGWATTGFGRGSSNLDVLGLWAPELADDADLPADFELDSEGNFDISFEAGGVNCDADGQLLPVNSAFNVYEAHPQIICLLIVFAPDAVELILAVMDTPDMPGGGGRALVLVVVPDERKIALGATFLLESP